MIEELIPRVFATRDAAHKAHWASKSYSEHMALGEFYEAIVDAIDTIVEAHQGAFGLVEPESPVVIVDTDILAHVKEEADWIEANRDLICSGSNAIGNLVDSLTGIYLKAIYKLENLK